MSKEAEDYFVDNTSYLAEDRMGIEGIAEIMENYHQSKINAMLKEMVNVMPKYHYSIAAKFKIKK